MNPIIYGTLGALNSVRKIVTEAAAAIQNKGRTIATSGIPEILGAVVGGGAGVGVGVVAVYGAGVTGLSAVGITSGLATLGSVVGGGMLAGVFVAGAPMAVLAVTGYGLLTLRNNRKLNQEKEALFQEALRLRDEILEELNEQLEMADDRVKYLEALNIKLSEVIENLEHDLGVHHPQAA